MPRGLCPKQHLLEQALWLASAPRPSLEWRSPSGSERAAVSHSGAGAFLKRQRSHFPSSARRKRSHKTNQDHSRSRGDFSASPRKSVDWHRANASVWDGQILLPVIDREVRDLVPSTPVLASGCPLNPVLLRVMPAATVSMLMTNQVATELLCLLVLTSPLVQGCVIDSSIGWIGR